MSNETTKEDLENMLREAIEAERRSSAAFRMRLVGLILHTTLAVWNPGSGTTQVSGNTHIRPPDMTINSDSWVVEDTYTAPSAGWQ